MSFLLDIVFFVKWEHVCITTFEITHGTIYFLYFLIVGTINIASCEPYVNNIWLHVNWYLPEGGEYMVLTSFNRLQQSSMQSFHIFLATMSDYDCENFMDAIVILLFSICNLFLWNCFYLYLLWLPLCHNAIQICLISSQISTKQQRYIFHISKSLEKLWISHTSLMNSHMHKGTHVHMHLITVEHWNPMA